MHHTVLCVCLPGGRGPVVACVRIICGILSNYNLPITSVSRVSESGGSWWELGDTDPPIYGTRRTPVTLGASPLRPLVQTLPSCKQNTRGDALLWSAGAGLWHERDSCRWEEAITRELNLRLSLPSVPRYTQLLVTQCHSNLFMAVNDVVS